MAGGLDAGLSWLDLFIVNFEPFCANSKPIERPESRVEHFPRRGAKAAKREKKS